jgi:hypothetical protein
MYNEICVCVNDIHLHPEAIVAACKFADRFNGRVTAVYIRPDVAEIIRWQGASPIDLATQMLADVDKQEQKAKDEFAALSKAYEIVKTWRTIPSSEEPHRHMLCCDLIFAAQPNKTHQQYPNNQSFINRLILQTKRPVLMIPNGWDQDSFGLNVLLGWNSSAEAMRAASDALPLLELSSSVTVLDILISRLFTKESSSLYYIQDYLSNKKIKNQLLIDNCAHNSEIPKQLIRRCKSEDIDLVVVGGYGHSRVKEVIMGGMTDYLIKHADVPVFFSH